MLFSVPLATSRKAARPSPASGSGIVVICEPPFGLGNSSSLFPRSRPLSAIRLDPVELWDQLDPPGRMTACEKFESRVMDRRCAFSNRDRWKHVRDDYPRKTPQCLVIAATLANSRHPGHVRLQSLVVRQSQRLVGKPARHSSLGQFKKQFQGYH